MVNNVIVSFSVIECNEELVDVAREIVEKLFEDDFPSKLRRNGWNISHHLLGLKEWRFDGQSLLKMK